MKFPALVFAGLSFCAWVVSLGGLAAVQDKCNNNDLIADTQCYRALRWEWFIIWWNFVTVVGVLATIGLGLYETFRLSWLAFVASVTVLYIVLADRWLNRADEDIAGSLGDSINALTAGLVMVSVFNCMLMFVLGIKDESESASSGKSAPPANTA